MRRARIGTLLADADFDAEWVHEAVRSHGIRTIVLATRGRPSAKPPAGRWRRRMKRRFGQYKRKYGQGWQVETVNSMIKRRLGSALRARVEANQSREIILRAITHKVMIVRLRVFYRATEIPLMRSPRATFDWRLILHACALTASFAHAGVAQRYLEPERGSLNESLPSLRYAMSLQKALLKNAAFYYRARVLCEPAFRSRWVATLVYEEDDRQPYFIEYAAFDAPAGGQSDWSSVQRLRVPIDRESAEAIQRVWLRMLRAVRHPDAPRMGADGVTYHFSRFVARGSDDPLAPAGWESGLIWTPTSASPTGRLASIGQAMKEYATAREGQRAEVRDRIRKETANLLADLDQ